MPYYLRLAFVLVAFLLIFTSIAKADAEEKDRSTKGQQGLHTLCGLEPPKGDEAPCGGNDESAHADDGVSDELDDSPAVDDL